MYNYNLRFSSYRLTVRTLDFHSKDVGSIPASLKNDSKQTPNEKTKFRKTFVFTRERKKLTTERKLQFHIYIQSFFYKKFDVIS